MGMVTNGQTSKCKVLHKNGSILLSICGQKDPLLQECFWAFPERKNNFLLSCNTMKNPPSQTLLDYSVLLLAVSPELYSITIVRNLLFPLWGGVRGWEIEPTFKMGEGCCYWPFSGSSNFHIKIKLKSEIFNDEKCLWTKMFFLCHI